VQVVQRAALPHRDALAVEIIVLGDRAAAGHLIPVADVETDRNAATYDG
jgi:hypothetical protein